ncbi:integral membrane sensor signal transduction histidine kinase [Novosphingobium sp. Rr 2-17]|uniref:sensor histidine kinase n=1 Tax=Novosphingobium sp. Rr 2-17 TaxID=555793 RepID=UPI000269AB2A|nr:HAMP domain-containing sensor histidine kinase [Novosphingobium sp. Rr 2-17]EIZ79600.1 integral membrane sensor signal transduction histidine kinase [Novosphingobium sp. Rr 2-17]
MNNVDTPVRPKGGPTLFRQIATRLAALTLVFAILNIGIVVVTYSQQPESLAQELLTLEARRIAESPQRIDALPRPAGSTHWKVSYLDRPVTHTAAEYRKQNPGALVDWTQRERIEGGYRVTGVRTIMQEGRQQWLFIQFEGYGLRPYLPVIWSEILQHGILPLIPLSLLMLAFNILAVRRVLDPLLQAEQEVDGLDPDNMAARLHEPIAPREVHTLVCAVNRALGRLENALSTLRAFTANAAHELRTPLAIMQLGIDRLPDSRDRDELSRENLAMTRMVGQMLDLAQADALLVDDAHQVDLANVAREVVTALAPRAFEQHRELRFEQTGEAIALGHEEAIYRVIRNLVDNALAHTSGDSPIEITAGPGPRFSVRDHGDGIPDADREHIFERFWRGDRRASTGAGLGLGIVKRLVEAHGGTVTVEDVPGGGTLFQVELQSTSHIGFRCVSRTISGS